MSNEIAADGNELIGDRLIQIKMAEKSAGLAQGLALEWKSSPARRLSVPRYATLDGIGVVQFGASPDFGWLRLWASLARPRDREANIVGLRLLVRIDGTGPAAAEFTPMLVRSNADGTRDGLRRAFKVVEIQPGQWHEIVGLYHCGPDTADQKIDFILRMPAQGVISIARVDSEWFGAADGGRELDPLAAMPIRPFEAFPVTGDLAAVVQSAAIYGHHFELVGTRLRGWLLGAGGGLSARVEGGLLQVLALTETIEVGDGLSVMQGVEQSIAGLIERSGGGEKLEVLAGDGRGLAVFDLPVDDRFLRGYPRFDLETMGLVERREATAKATTLVFFPDYRVTNPYQRLLYGAMPSVDARPGTVLDALNLAATGQERVVLHLHWLNPLLAGCQSFHEADKRRRDVADQLRAFVRMGGILLWTVHNIVSHSANFREVEQQLGQDVADYAAAVHVHSPSLMPLLAEYYLIAESKIVFSQHPNYIGQYADYVPRQVARRRLGVPDGAKLFLFVGQLRPYKGVEQLVDAFQTLRETVPDAYLVVAGEPIHPYKPGMLRQRFGVVPNVQVIEGRIPDNDLQWYYNACDWVVLPYRNILTSGSLLCALSLKRPVIAPEMGMITDLLKDGVNGIVYSAEEQGALEAALLRGARTEPSAVSAMGTAAIEAVRDLTWLGLGGRLQDAVDGYARAFRAVCLPFETGAQDCLLTGPAFPPGRRARTAIVILNYEHVKDTARLVASIEASTDTDYDIYIVDNCSESTSIQDLRLQFSGHWVLRLGENLGYAAGNNAALHLIRRLDYPFILILNPDMEITPDALGQFVEAAERFSDVSIFGPTVCRGDTPTHVSSAGGRIEFANGLVTGHMYPGMAADVLPGDAYFADYITGAAIFMRGAALQVTGFIPEHYFLYYEETDWCRRAAEKGMRCLVLPWIRLLHHKRSEEGGLPAKYYFYYYIRNTIRFARRFCPDAIKATLQRLNGEFITPWLKRIESQAPDRLGFYKGLSDRALLDGHWDCGGKIDLLALEIQLTHELTAGIAPGDVTGAVRLGEDGHIVGWVALAQKPHARLKVSLASRNAIIETVVAEATAVAEFDDRGAKGHGFEFTLPLEYRDGREHQFTFYVEGVLIAGAGFALRGFLPRPAPVIAGRIDGVRYFRCNGWLVNRSDPSEVMIAEVLHEDRVIGRAKADQFRADLRRNGLNNGKAAFSVRLPKRFADGKAHMLRLRAYGTTKMVFEREVSDGAIAGGAVPTLAREVLADLFFNRQIWLSAYSLEDLPVGRFLASARRHLAARHGGAHDQVKVSVIMPTFNRADSIIESVRSVVAQTHRNWELIIVDDGSKDNTVEIVRQFLDVEPDSRIIFLPQVRNGGVSVARNVALKASSGDVIAYLDSDNVWMPEFLTIMAGELMAAGDNVEAAYCGQVINQICIDGDAAADEVIALRMGHFDLALLENRNYIDLNCFIHRRSAYERLGGFNEAMRRLVDWELILRYASHVIPHFVPAALSTYYFDKVDNQITEIETVGGNIEHLEATSRALARLPLAASGALRPVDIAILAPGIDNIDALAMRLRETAQASKMGEGIAAIAVYADPAIAVDLALRMTGVEVREIGPDVDFGALAADAAKRRRPGVDLALLDCRALVAPGWLRGINAALRQLPEGALFLTRNIVDGRAPEARGHAPFSVGDRNVSITLSAELKNVVNPCLDRQEHLIEVSHFRPFCTYVVGDVADCLPTVQSAGASGEAFVADLCDFIRFELSRRIVYCGKVRAFNISL